MVSKKLPWRFAVQRAFPDPSAHRNAAFCGTGHAEGRPGESIAIQWHLRAAAFASSEGTPLRRCLPPLSRPCRHIRLLRAQRQVQPYLFWRKAAGRRQGASFQAGQRGAGANGAGIDQCFPVSPSLCARRFRRSGCVFLHCAHCAHRSARNACFCCVCPGNRAATLQRGSEAWYNK